MSQEVRIFFTLYYFIKFFFTKLESKKNSMTFILIPPLPQTFLIIVNSKGVCPRHHASEAVCLELLIKHIILY